MEMEKAAFQKPCDSALYRSLAIAVLSIITLILGGCSDLLLPSVGFIITVHPPGHLSETWIHDSTVAEPALFYQVQMLSDSSGWAVGISGENGLVYHYDGTGWKLDTKTSSWEHFFCIDMLNDTDGWLGGNGGRFYRFDGADWALHTTTAEGSTINGISMLSESSGWASGSGNGRMYKFYRHGLGTPYFARCWRYLGCVHDR